VDVERRLNLYVEFVIVNFAVIELYVIENVAGINAANAVMNVWVV
jgi:hypothetical protein